MAIETIDADKLNSDHFGKYSVISGHFGPQQTATFGVISEVKHEFEQDRTITTTLTLTVSDSGSSTSSEVFAFLDGNYEVIVSDSLVELVEHALVIYKENA